MKTLQVFAPGTTVKLKDAPALVVGVGIYEDGVVYKCVWWSGSDRKEQWVSSLEVSPYRETEVVEVEAK